jgi:hypothetical protein
LPSAGNSLALKKRVAQNAPALCQRAEKAHGCTLQRTKTVRFFWQKMRKRASRIYKE